MKRDNKQLPVRTTQNYTTKSGYIAIIGKPNVGKSTLMNAFIEQKLSIVTPKPQTTRSRVLGIITNKNSQMILLDTPGLFQPREKLGEAMRKQINISLKDADVVLALAEAIDMEGSLDEGICNIIKATKVPCIVAVNKIDLVSEAKREGILQDAWQKTKIGDILPVSALYGYNILELKSVIEGKLPYGPFFYPEDIVSAQPERFFIAELIREEIFLGYSQEIPYATGVSIDEFREDRSKKTYIRVIIYVERETQKAILIGKEGKALKEIGQRARLKIEEFLEKPVYLELWVKVYAKWRQKESALREMGYLD